MELKYCVKCVMPNSRPGLTFNSIGVCSACEGAEEKKKEIDWISREKELNAIFDKFRSKDKMNYDCIVPVSGGKDSIYQVHMVKNVYNMNPLCVTFRTDARTPIGEHNIQVLREIGVDHIDFTPNPIGFNKLRKKTFETVGDTSLPDHLAIWGVIPNIALKFKIPLVIWGENPDMEYGGTKDMRKVAKLNRNWMKGQHILKGKTVQDWCDNNLKINEISCLIPPKEEDLDSIDYTPIFIGYYLPWDAKRNVEVAIKHGFKVRKEGPIMGLYDYADIDCKYIVLHHYFKFLKFGFNRVTDNACNEIRKGRMTREQAKKLVIEKDGVLPPKEYVEDFCKRVGITVKHFWEVAERFRNKDVWYKDTKGKWQLKGWIGGNKIPEEWRNPLEKGEI